MTTLTFGLIHSFLNEKTNKRSSWHKSIFYRLFNPIAFEESDFNYGEDIQYLKNLIDAAIIQSIKKLDEPKMTITKIEHKPV